MLIDAKTWTAAPEEIGEIARRAEEMGFAGFWNNESAHDPYMGMALAATATSHIDLGIAIALAFPRSPTIAATSAWDVQRVSRGRFILGLGTQVKAHITRRFGMPWGPPAPRMREYVQAVRALWDCWQDKKPLNFAGQHYAINLVNPEFNPGPIFFPRPPIYLAGAGPRMVRLTGELATGILVHPLNSVRYLKEAVLPGLREGAARAGRNLDDIVVCSSVFVITGRSKAERAEQRRSVRRKLAFFASTPTYRATLLDPYGWGEINERLNQLAKQGKWDEMEPHVPEDMEAAMAVTGEWDELLPQIRRRYEGLVHRMHLYLDFRPGEQDEFWRTFARGIHG